LGFHSFSFVLPSLLYFSPQIAHFCHFMRWGIMSLVDEGNVFHQTLDLALFNCSRSSLTRFILFIDYSAISRSLFFPTSVAILLCSYHFLSLSLSKFPPNSFSKTYLYLSGILEVE
jgi:hypothetical protein